MFPVLSRSLAFLFNMEYQHLVWKAEDIICSEWEKRQEGLVISQARD